MSFKDELEADLEAVFLQADEFAAPHRIEGQEVLCVVDNDKGNRKGDGGMYDLAEMDYTIMAKTEDLPARKEPGSLLNLDGKELTIGTWDEQEGLTIIGLYSPTTA